MSSLFRVGRGPNPESSNSFVCAVCVAVTITAPSTAQAQVIGTRSLLISPNSCQTFFPTALSDSEDLPLAGILKRRRSLFQKAETSERMRLISVDAIFSETLKRLCVSDSVSKRFDQV